MVFLIIFLSFFNNQVIDKQDFSMDSVEAIGSRTPLGTLTPSQQNSEARETDFSTLTPSHFGISTDSFLTFSKEKGEKSQNIRWVHPGQILHTVETWQ